MGIIFDREKAIADVVDDPDGHFLAAPVFIYQDGFSVTYNLGNSLFSCARDEAVRKHPVPGRLWHWFPKTGRFYIGFVLIDDPDRTFGFDVYIQKQLRFRVTTSRCDGLRHIYFTDEALDVEYAQTLELRFAGDGSRQAVEGLVFLTEPPAERLAKSPPIRVRREAVPLTQEAPAEFLLCNPGEFRLRHELMRLALPAHWPEDTVLRTGQRNFPYAAAGPGAVDVLVNGTAGKNVRVRAVADSAALRSTQAAVAGLMVVATPAEVSVRDEAWVWHFTLRDGRLRVMRGAQALDLVPVLESGDVPPLPRTATLAVAETSPLAVTVDLRCEFAGFLHGTRLRVVQGSARVELEHLLEVHANDPFAYLHRYGLRLEVASAASCGVRSINADGTTVPLTEFLAFYHTDRDLEQSRPGLPHSLQWAGMQFTLQEMACSAPVRLAARAAALEIDLLPTADAVKPDADEEYRIRNQFFLENGSYKLRQGMARRHFSCLQMVAPDASADVLYEAGRLDEPPYLHLSGYQDGGRFETAPRFARQKLYRDTVQRWTSLFLANRAAMRSVGFFSYGDWFGERVNNWGNSEYDTPYAFLLHFLATGDPVLRRLGMAAARHQLDVDTFHGEHSDAGWQITHSMAHGGRYYPDEYRVGAYSHGGVGVAHVWVEGMLLYSRLTGDPRARQTAVKLLDDLAGPELKNWAFTNGRDAGWHLIHLCAGYRELGDQRYLEAAATLVEKILERQRKDGSFRRVLTSDHCATCYPKHTGEVSFMMGFLLEGLKRFHALTDDPLVWDAIIALARSVVAEMWDAKPARFRYTSCPNSKPIESAMMLEGLSYAARLAGDRKSLATWRRELRKIAAEEMPRHIVTGQLKYGDGACGKILSQRLRMLADACHELL